jgi:hypothetical protein
VEALVCRLANQNQVVNGPKLGPWEICALLIRANGDEMSRSLAEDLEPPKTLGMTSSLWGTSLITWKVASCYRPVDLDGAFLFGVGKCLMETPACWDHTGCFSLLLKERTVRLELGPLLPHRRSTAVVFIMAINQAFRCTYWGTSCRKQVYLGTERMGDCGECWGLPDVFHINRGPTAGETGKMWI